MRVITVPQDAPHDLHRHTARILPARRYAGVIPGELVTLRFEGRPVSVPGFVYCVNFRDDVIIVEEDYQSTMAY